MLTVQAILQHIGRQGRHSAGHKQLIHEPRAAGAEGADREKRHDTPLRRNECGI